MDEFESIRKQFEMRDEAREALIKRSRAILKASKQAIYALHRDEVAQAKELLTVAQKEKQALTKEFLVKDPLSRTGGFSNACEEYAEALAFLIYLEEGRLMTLEESNVTPEEYLGGLADLTGELGRRAVLLATARDKNAVQKIRDFSDALYGQFVKFDFRNGELRRKYDSIKYNLQKMENLLYELK